jgi:hypothetical protein
LIEARNRDSSPENQERTIMASGFAATANMMLDSTALKAIETNLAGGGGHHHHHHGNSGKSNQDATFGIGSGSDSDSGSSSTNDHLKHALQKLVDASSQHRLGIIVTLSFSILAALIILYTIVRDAYKVRPGEVYSRAQ